jgi:YfiH family protein
MVEVAIEGPVPRLELADWREQYGILAGITRRGLAAAPFDLGLGGTSSPVGAVLGRWRAFRASVPSFSGVVVSHQVHGNVVSWHESLSGMLIDGDGDGHATATSGVLLTVTTADCVPVYLADPVAGQVALAHAGWRGTAAGILEQALAVLTTRGSRVENVLIHCGVGICGRCYEVGAEVFTGLGLPVPPNGKGQVDLRQVLVEEARRQGADKVSTSQFCSAHDPGFFSHRAGRGADGRMVAYLGIMP